MNSGKTVFAQLMDFLPTFEFHQCVERYRGDYKVTSFSCWDQYDLRCQRPVAQPSLGVNSEPIKLRKTIGSCSLSDRRSTVRLRPQDLQHEPAQGGEPPLLVCLYAGLASRCFGWYKRDTLEWQPSTGLSTVPGQIRIGCYAHRNAPCNAAEF